MGSKEEFINFAWVARHGVRKVKAQVGLILVRDAEENNKCFRAMLAVKGRTRKIWHCC